MANLLKLLPKVEHTSVTLSNLLVKVAVVKQHLDKFTVYYPYSVKEGERPDTIAYDYYGNSEYAWLILLVNGIVDPYLQWPLDTNTFHEHLRVKYGILWETKNMIHHYHYTGTNDDSMVGYIDYPMTVQTYNSTPIDQRIGWTPVYVYDYELSLNDQKRSIKLLSNQYLKQVDRELTSLLG